MRKYAILILLFLWSFQNIYAQAINDLFEKRNELSKDYHQISKNYQALQLNTERLKTLQSNKAAELSLQLPFENKLLKLQLKKVKITADNFSVIEAGANGSRRTITYPDAVFYQGKIDGQSSSFATISFVGDEVVGVIADNKSNIVLGTIQKDGLPTKEYTLYRESDLKIPNPLNCFTNDEYSDGSVSGTSNTNTLGRLTAVGEPVDIYFECDYRFYQDKGNNTINVINYVLGFFNNTALLYANEDIQIQVSQILVWTSQDPEAAAGLNSTSTVLNAFSTRMGSATYVGDYAHFLSTRSLGGGIAWLLNNACSSSQYYRSAVSAINNTYSDYPTYSWTVEVVTHELGHNLGSHHTQWCGWSGGPIDNCYPVEGTCAPGPTPVNGGSIMSYCHLSSIGINLSNGFGQQPGDAIRSLVGSSSCFGNCKMTIDITKQDASCGQNNGTAAVTTTNSTGTLTYLWSNGQTGAALANAAPGTYHVTVTDASGCQVMEDVIIGNSGTTLSFSLTPNVTAGFCTGSNLTLVTTNNPSYSYQWKLNGNPIGGATSYSYTTNNAGNYSVTVTSGACSGTQSVIVSQVATPTATITPAATTTFCDGSNVTLNANAGSSYTYQWYKNGSAINGATNASFAATASGNYSVKVAAGNNCEATSTNTVVTVNPSPSATITAGSVTSFCQGGSVQFTASSGTGYGYEWYRNGTLINGANTATFTANTSGDYTEKATIGSCSKTSTATTVTVWPNPVVTISPNSSTIQKFQTQTLTGGGAPNFDWGSQPGYVSSTATTVILKPLTTTNYNIKGWDINNCENTATATIIVIGCGDVTNISTTSYSPSRVLVKWTNPQGVTSDTLQYRKTGTATWNKIFVTGQEFELNNLEPDKDYEYNIIPLCNTTTVFIPSSNQTFKTKALENGLYTRLAPNPVTGTSKLEIISANNFTLDISIYDNTGKLIRAISSSENHTAGQVVKSINAATLANGIYHISIKINDKKQTITMVVAH